MNSSVPQQLDVVVVGGGPAGAVVALQLSRLGLSVLILERSRYAERRIGEMLPPESRSLLESLGLWDEFLRAGHLASPGLVSAWETAEPIERDFLFNPYGTGWHLDRSRFDEFLIQQAVAAGTQVLTGVRLLDQPRHDGGRWELAISERDGARSISGRFLIDASGRSAWLGRRLRIRRVALDHLTGIIGFWPASQRRDCRLLQEAFEHGWWYSGLLPGGAAVAACMIDADTMPHDPSAMRDFCRRSLKMAPLTENACCQDGEPIDIRSVSANTSRLERLSGIGWLAVGDAAITHAPLSARGIRHALLSASRAAPVVVDFVRHERDSSADYCKWQEFEFRTYRQRHQQYYAQVTRWPNSNFWQCRASGTDLR